MKMTAATRLGSYRYRMYESGSLTLGIEGIMFVVDENIIEGGSGLFKSEAPGSRAVAKNLAVSEKIW